MHEVNLFIITFFAALVGVIPPGLVNMAVAKTCVDINKKAGKYKAFGAASVVFVQALIAILIAKEILKNPEFKDNILLVGLFVLSVLLVYFIISARRQKPTPLEHKSAKLTKSFMNGVVISGLNVFPIPYFVVISTLFTPQNHIDFTWTTKLIFSLSAALGSLTTFLLYVYFFDKIIKQNKLFKTYSNYFMAALMLCLLLITLYRLYG
ncbi:LysE family translocator [Mesohalobacter halotolerans]|uniref:Lysine transporter LysE n=1 Tax=Mesohalobacter halotolerans TaxID=1883405 RepID=A0A4U5TT52_9FLAO|nr:LysE family transporter [Mesohalobacter halotolerans]MBS3738808.1 LysE family transporter [Psychroflexus sp.]TKS57530.1 lysine transporter LysE [Mesohalobacter halotolerans]